MQTVNYFRQVIITVICMFMQLQSFWIHTSRTGVIILLCYIVITWYWCYLRTDAILAQSVVSGIAVAVWPFQEPTIQFSEDRDSTAHSRRGRHRHRTPLAVHSSPPTPPRRTPTIGICHPPFWGACFGWHRMWSIISWAYGHGNLQYYRMWFLYLPQCYVILL